MGSSERRTGFTLIELLVVIAIIAILAAMLFPVFARARESARKIRCLANVKNAATAIQMYMADYDRLPPSEHRQEVVDFVAGCAVSPTNINPFLRWQVILDEYTRNRDIWECPNAKYVAPYTVIPNYPPGGWFQYTVDNWDAFGANNLYPCNPCFPPGWGGTITDSLTQGVAVTGSEVSIQGSVGRTGGAISPSIGYNEQYDLPLSKVNDPAWYVICGDLAGFSGLCSGPQWIGVHGVPQALLYDTAMVPCHTWPGAGPVDPVNCPWTVECSPFTSQENVEKFRGDPSFRREWTRHLGGSNIGFLDGHAQWLSADAFNANRPYCECCSDESGYSGQTWHYEGRSIEGVCPSSLP